MAFKDSDQLDQAAARRDLAKRARRMAQELASADRTRLLRYAEDMEEQAARLEACAAEPAPLPIAPIPRQQTQVQQQQQGPAKANGSKPVTPKP
jgi:hypothetical protein